MKRLNLSFFMELGAALEPLNTLPPRVPEGDDDQIEAPATFRRNLFHANRALETLLEHETIPLAIPASRPAAQELSSVITNILRKNNKVRQDMWDAYWYAQRLQTLLQGELAVQSVYHIWPKRAFDINLLIEKATSLFSKEVQQWMTEDERYNIAQAGKCIAFETPTAAGFHLIRAAESVIRRYYAVVVGVAPVLKMRNWGAYIKNLKKCNGEPRVIHALEQIKDLHRNPVIHPEIALSLEESISLIGITESVVSSIYADMILRKERDRPQNLLMAQSSETPLVAANQ